MNWWKTQLFLLTSVMIHSDAKRELDVSSSLTALGICIAAHLLHYFLALRCIEREDKQCHGSYVTETRKRWPFVGLEPLTFCYPRRCPKPIRVEETSNRHLASECIVIDANNFDILLCRLKYYYVLNNNFKNHENDYLFFVSHYPFFNHEKKLKFLSPRFNWINTNYSICFIFISNVKWRISWYPFYW